MLSQVRAAPDEATLELEQINQWRAWAGLGPLSRNSALEAAAHAHAQYYFLNAGDPDLTGIGLHREKPGKPGFTGEDLVARARAHGYSGSVNENIGLTGSLLTAVQVFLSTINHRLPFLDPRYHDIGFGTVNENGIRIEVIMVGSQASWSEQSEPTWVIWPVNGLTGVGTHFWGEAPNPFPQATYPLGYPVTAKYFGPGEVVFTRGSLFQDGRSLPVYFATGNGWLSRRTALLAATAPSTPATTYEWEIEGTINGQSFQVRGTFRTAGSPEERLAPGLPNHLAPLPPGMSAAPVPIQKQWHALDGPVALGLHEGWIFRPDAWAIHWEPYAESPGGERQVVYLDKARLELTDPNGDTSSPWFVTSGLLVTEMVLGRMHSGDQQFVPRLPAEIPIAGDPAPFNPEAPTYASLRPHSALTRGEPVPPRLGEVIREVLLRDGTVLRDPVRTSTASSYAAYDAVTGHNIAHPFGAWFEDQLWDPLLVVGRPISEPYWVRARVNGVMRWIVVQAFERRVLTYTPDNPPGWQVEMGNVGRHYYEWRYNTRP